MPLKLLILLACIAPFLALGDGPAPVHIRVKITIAGENGEDAIVRSYLAKYFRKVGDIDIVDSKPDIRVDCIIMDIKNGGGLTGYALSYAITSQGGNNLGKITLELHKKSIDADSADILGNVFTNDGTLLDHFGELCSPDSLEDGVSKDAAKIDGNDIETMRPAK